MRKVVITIILLILFALFFFLPIIPSDKVYMKDSQREEMIALCKVYGCGVSFEYTPFQYLKESIRNMASN